MATLYSYQDHNNRRTWWLFFLFFAVAFSIGWLFSFVFQDIFILYFTIILAFSMNIFSYWFSDKVVLKIAGAREISEEEFKELHRLVENLSMVAGLPKPKIYLINDPAPNAFATGRNPKNSVVAFTSGLLNLLDKSELEGVIAHELSHIGNRDVFLATVSAVLVGFVIILSDVFLRLTLLGHRGDNSQKKGAFQLVILILGMVSAFLAPLAVFLIQLAISRRREFLADTSGVLLTRYPEGLINALKKIEGANLSVNRASQATAHLYIVNPFKGDKNKLKSLSKLMSTHPPVEDRIKQLEGRL